MTDPYADRLAAAKRRLEEAAALAEETDASQGTNERRLAQLSEEIDALAAAHGVDVALPTAPAVGPPPADCLSDASQQQRREPEYIETSARFSVGLAEDGTYLADQGVERVGWDDLLSPAACAEIEARLQRPVRAEPMDRADLVTVGVSAGLAIVAVVLDDTIDGVIKDRLCDLHDPSSPLGQSDLGSALRRWDKDGTNLAIDYSGQGIGGGRGVHRVRSAGHDLLRPFEAIEQIRSGQFQGHRWEEGVKIAVSADRPHLDFASYRQVESANAAIFLWLKHLASDFTTDKSLPLPGATFLHEVPNHTLRSIGAESYKGGLNMRRVLVTGMLPVATVEAGVRMTVHIRTWRETGTARLSPERKAKLQNMLLLSHGMVAAASAGKVGVAWSAEGPAALRHLNVAVVAAVGRYAMPVMAQASAETIRR